MCKNKRVIQRRGIKITAIVLVLIAMAVIYLNHIRPAYEAMQLVQYGKPARAIRLGQCGFFITKMPKEYLFVINGKSYFGNYALPDFGILVGDTIDILYLPNNAKISMSEADVKSHTRSIWSIFFSNK